MKIVEALLGVMVVWLVYRDLADTFGWWPSVFRPENEREEA